MSAYGFDSHSAQSNTVGNYIITSFCYSKRNVFGYAWMAYTIQPNIPNVDERPWLKLLATGLSKRLTP